MSTETVSARCATHPDQPAVATCARCGDYACAACFDSLSEQCQACDAIASAPAYHVVPVGRFVGMTLVTMGLYVPYWMYRQWAAIKRRDQSDIWPLPRAIFAGFTFFGLLDDINTTSLRRELPPLNKGLGVVLLIGGGLSRAPDPVGLLSIFTGLAVVPACQRIWELSSAQAREANAGFRARHLVATLLGLLLWAGLITDMVFPEPEPDPYGYYGDEGY